MEYWERYEDPIIVSVKPYGHYAKISEPIYDEMELDHVTAELITECRRAFGLFIAIEVEVRKAPEGKR